MREVREERVGSGKTNRIGRAKVESNESLDTVPPSSPPNEVLGGELLDCTSKAGLEKEKTGASRWGERDGAVRLRKCPEYAREGWPKWWLEALLCWQGPSVQLARQGMQRAALP